ncbi:MAG TPA: hypothetical protein VF266_27235, partial [Thermoanaerobaculia bacterium]
AFNLRGRRIMLKAADMLCRFLVNEFEKNASKTIVFWSDKWALPVEDLVALLRGSTRMTKKTRHMYQDLPFTREEYEAAEHVERPSIPENLKPLFKNLRGCPGCSKIVPQSKWDAHECPPEPGRLYGAPVDTRGRENAGVAQNALLGDPDWPPLFFGGGLPTLGKRR